MADRSGWLKEHATVVAAVIAGGCSIVAVVITGMFGLVGNNSAGAGSSAPASRVTTRPSTPSPSTPISFPSDGQHVDVVVWATGDVNNVSEGHQIWTVVEVVGPDGHPAWDPMSQAESRLWPGAAAIVVSPDGTWRAPVIFGANVPKHSGLVFRLSLVEVDANVARIFDQYNRTAQREQYPGLLKGGVGEGMKVLQEVTVTRI